MNGYFVILVLSDDRSRFTWFLGERIAGSCGVGRMSTMRFTAGSVFGSCGVMNVAKLTLIVVFPLYITLLSPFPTPPSPPSPTPASHPIPTGLSSHSQVNHL